MSIKTSIELIAERVGFDIANSDDQVQGDLINGFCDGLRQSMNDSNRSTQICYFVDKVKPINYAILQDIAGFVDLKATK